MRRKMKDSHSDPAPPEERSTPSWYCKFAQLSCPSASRKPICQSIVTTEQINAARRIANRMTNIPHREGLLPDGFFQPYAARCGCSQNETREDHLYGFRRVQKLQKYILIYSMSMTTRRMRISIAR